MAYGIEFAKDYTFPKTKFRSVRDTGKSKNAHKLFHYWRAIPEGKRELVIVKVYRLWPVVDLKALDQNATIEWDTLRGEIPFPVEDYENAFLHRYGSGEWRVLLTEAGVSGAIMEAYFSAIDLETYPPKIDLNTLVRGNFKNQDYVKWLERQPGLELPWNTPEDDAEQKEREEEEMQIGGVATELAKSQGEILNTLVKKHIEDGTQDPASAGMHSEALSEGMKAYTEMVTEGAKASIEVLKEQATASSKQYDPVAMMHSAADLFVKFRGNGDSNLDLLKMVVDSHEKTVTAVQAMHAETLNYFKQREEEREPETLAVAKNGVDGLLEEAEKYERLAKMFGWSRRGGEKAIDAGEQPSKPGVVMKLLTEQPQLVMGVATMLNGLVYNLACMFTKDRPKSPQELLAEANLNPAANQQPMRTQPTVEEQTRMYIEGLEVPLLTHLFDVEQRGLNGNTFALEMLHEFKEGPPTPNGQQNYRAIKETWGKQTFDALLRRASYWSRIQPLSIQSVDKTPPKYQTFLDQFFSADEYWAQQAQQGKTAN